ncbi:MAG: site-2 protease family protein [Candidatus Acidiferrales bacterium]|jgi:membrane-associated protease RseP (regulator of RpoE activity)
MSSGNGHARIPPEILDYQLPPIELYVPARPRRRPVALPLVLFLLTVISTLAVGAEFARSYANGVEAFSTDDNLFRTMAQPILHPGMLLLGIPFSFTLLTILLAHELGHYFACRLNGIEASYPYFIPAPTLFGTFGAFIQIRSRIPTRRALFDVGLSGPVVGFIFSIPALIFAIANSKFVPHEMWDPNALHFLNPPLIHLLVAIIRPNENAHDLMLNPVGRAAWVGLFVTALNLLPGWQLDGGHILYSLAPTEHRRISIFVGAVLLVMGWFMWPGWYLWGGLILAFSIYFRHPPLVDRYEQLDPRRRFWTVIAIAIFLLSFTPWPTT